VVCAACCHMALVFAIMHLQKYVYCFCPFLFIFFFNLVLICWTEWLTMPACPRALCAPLMGLNLCFMFVYVLFYVCVGTGFAD